MFTEKTLHFSLGPVQGFVAQARRTRDFWAGSFLLSYLSAIAIDYIMANGGEIIFPTVIDNEGELDPLLLAIAKAKGNKQIINPPKFGSIPNRFQAKIPADFNPQGCSEAIVGAWLDIADKVYEKYIKTLANHGNDTYTIWTRQVENFWDIVWIIGDEPYLLDYRKNWRSYVPEPEPGDKCTLMSNMQEISGYNRVKQRQEQKKFWTKMQEVLPVQDLRDDERLCAVALVKRLFPYVAQDTIGWQLIDSFPSTMYLSAIPWLDKTLENNKELAEGFIDETSKSTISLNEYNTKIKSLTNKAGENKKLQDFIKLDGNCFYPSTLDNDKLWDASTKESREKLKKILKNEKISPFYALLLMDGDKMGALLQDYPDKQKEISKALNDFSQKVPNIVENNDGILIFAGGDDVLAFIPLNKAIKTANMLRRKYQKCFLESLSQIPPEELLKKATISAAIVYAHNRAPLNLVYSYSQELLANKAKEETGRDALAIAIWKTGGVTIEWASPWEKIVSEEERNLNLLDRLTENTSVNNAPTANSFSSSFLYHLRKYLIFKDGAGYSSTTDEDLAVLLAAEYLRTRTEASQETNPERIKTYMGELTEIMKIYLRNDKGEVNFTQLYNPDGALVIRFLANKGVIR